MRAIYSYSAVILLILIFLSACGNLKTSGKAIDIEKEKIKQQFEQKPEPKLTPIDISNDPKKQEVMIFLKSFLSSILFPEVEAVPVQADPDSFELVGFTVDGTKYTTTTQFRLRTMKGPVKKQYLVILNDNGDNKYDILYVREDK